jgi:hypothetical protein
MLLPFEIMTVRSGNVLIEMPKDKRYLKILENLVDTLKIQLELEEEIEKEKIEEDEA